MTTTNNSRNLPAPMSEAGHRTISRTVPQGRNSLLNIASLDDAMRAAELMSKSGLVPQAFRNRPADILVAMQWGAEMGIQPMQAINSISVIQGKPSIYGDLGKALIMRRAGLDLIDYSNEVDGDGGDRAATCRIERANPNGKAIVVERRFSMADAKRASLLGKGPWVTYPDRMLSWRAFWLAARDIYPDVLGGIQGGEEMDDWRRSERPDDREHPSASSRVVAAANIEGEPKPWSREDMVGDKEPEPEPEQPEPEQPEPEEPVEEEGESAEAIPVSPLARKTKEGLIDILRESCKAQRLKEVEIVHRAQKAGVPYKGGNPMSMAKRDIISLVEAVNDYVPF